MRAQRITPCGFHLLRLHPHRREYPPSGQSR